MAKKIVIIGLVATLLISTIAFIPLGVAEDVGEYLDQRQIECIFDGISYGVGEIDTYRSSAQSFIPALSTLTKAYLFISISNVYTFDIKISIRNSLDGEDLTSVIRSSDELPDFYLCWAEFNFSDLDVTIGETYYIVASVVDSGRYNWVVGENTAYTNGEAWHNDTYLTDGWETYTRSGNDNNNYDFCFETYGIGEGSIDVVYVDDDFVGNEFGETTPGMGYDHFTSIQEGIDAVDSSGTVQVFSGTYSENVVIDKRINLIGEDRDITFISASVDGDAVFVYADSVVISGFTIQTTGSMSYPPEIDAGIEISAGYAEIKMNKFTVDSQCGISISEASSKYNTIEENVFSFSEMDDRVGILLTDSSENIIKQNTFTGTQASCIVLDSSNGNLVSKNEMTLQGNFAQGIVLGSIAETVSENIVSSNTITYTGTGSNDTFFGIRLSNAPSNIIFNNTITKLSDWSDSQDYCIFLASSPDCNIYDNIISGASVGMAVDNSGSSSIGIYITNNIVTDCRYGIEIDGSNNEIINNFISGSNYGIYLDQTSSNQLINNTIKENDYAFYIYESYDNVIYHNNFIDNTEDVFNILDYGYEPGVNIWDNGYPSGGNYWDDYIGVDTDPTDGIGDTPYDIPHTDDQDHYPFIDKDGWIKILNIQASTEILEREIFEVIVTSHDIPIENVLVNLSAVTYYTNTMGITQVTAPSVSSDTTMLLTAYKNGYESAQVSITIRANTTDDLGQLNINISSTVEEGELFTITIKDMETDIYVVNVDVTFNEETKQTDSSGRVWFFAPFVDEDKEYTITAQHNDYHPVTTTIMVLDSKWKVPIILISPNGNESFFRNQSIKWSITTSETLTNHAVTIQYQYSYGPWITIIDNHNATSSSYLWDTTTVSDGYPYVIKVTLRRDNDTDGIYETFVSEDTSDAPFAIDNSLTSQGWIHGWITDNDSMSLEDAMVCIILMNVNNIITSKCMFANETGEYRMSIHAGTYTVSAFKSGYQKTTVDGVRVWANETTEVNFTLQQGTSSDIDLFFLDENRDQINRAIKEQQVGAEISIIKDVSGMQYEKHVLVYDSVTIFPRTVKDGQISLLVNGNEDIAGKTIVINLGENLLNRNEKLSIEYDGETISMADNLLDVLNANDDGAHPEYLITFGKDGVQILISIPHFSEHEITIYSLSPEEITLYTQLAVIAAVIIIAVSAIVLFRKGKEE